MGFGDCLSIPVLSGGLIRTKDKYSPNGSVCLINFGDFMSPKACLTVQKCCHCLIHFPISDVIGGLFWQFGWRFPATDFGTRRSQKTSTPFIIWFWTEPIVREISPQISTKPCLWHQFFKSGMEFALKSCAKWCLLKSPKLVWSIWIRLESQLVADSMD